MDSLIESYSNIMKLQDTRVSNWPFLQTPLQPLAALGIYILVLYFGTMFMKNREAFQLKTFLYIYNFLQVIGSFYIFYEILTTAIQSGYSLVCQPVDYSNNPLAIRMARALWLYYITKIIDLIDTVVFVLRKKNNQITFLHVFHHLTMVLNGWSGALFVPGGQTFFLAMLNSLVHTVMYGYYGLSALGPAIQKYLWWKKYLTQMQLIQFGFVLVHSTVNLISGCNYPRGFNIAFISYGLFLTFLFMNFYRQSYKDAARQKAKRKADSQNGHSTKTKNN